MILITTIRRSAFALASLFLLILLIPGTGYTAEPLVNINQADTDVLAENLTGIGPAKAKAIVAFRALNGPFKTVDELIKVKGIGPRTLEKIRAQILVIAGDQLAREHDAVAPTASGRAGSHVNIEQDTRRAVRSVIAAARRSSAAADKP